jgi:tape measure domain-containing protein
VAEAVLELDISPALSAVDDIDSAFDAMVEQLSAELNSAFSNVRMNLPDVAGATSEVGQLSGALDEAADAGGRASSQMDGFSAATNLVENGLSRIGVAFSKGTTAVAGFGAAFLTMSIFKGIERFTTIQDSVAALTITLGSAGAAAEFVDKILNVVRGTPFNLDQFVEAGKNLVAFNVDAAKVPTILTAIGEAASASGRGAQAVDSLTYAFGKMAATGRVSLDEVWTISASGINALEVLANGFGVTTEEMQKMISSGTVPAAKAIDVLSDGIINGTATTKALGGSMEKLRDTLSGAFGGMQAAMARFGVAFIEPFATQFTKAFTGVADLLDKFTPKIKELLTTVSQSEPIKKLGEFFADLPDKIGPVLDLVKKLGPALGPIIGMLVSIATRQLAGALGPLSFLVPTLGPLVGIFAGLAVASPELRDALGDLFAVIVPLIGQLAKEFAPILASLAGIAGDAAAGIVRWLTGALIELAPIVQNVVEWIGRFAREVGTVLRAALEGIGDFLSSLGVDVGELGASLGEALGVVGAAGVGLTVLGVGIDKLSTIVEGLSIGFDLIAAHPIVAAVVALGIAFYVAYQNCEPFREIVDDLWETLQSNLLPVLETVGDYLKTGFTDGVAIAKDVFSDLKGAWDDVQSALSGGLSVGEGGGTLGVLADAANALADANHNLSEALAKSVPQAKGLGDALGPLALIISPLGTALAFVYEKFEPFAHLVDNALEALGPFVDQVASQLLPVFERLAVKFDEVAPKVEKIATTFLEVATDALTPLMIGLALLFEFLSNEIGPVLDYVGEQFTTIWNAVADVVIGVVDIVVGALSLVIDLINGDWSAAWEDLQEIVSGALSVVNGLVGFTFGSIVNTINLALGTIGAVFRTVWDQIATVVSAVLNGIYAVISGIFNAIIAVTVGAWNLVYALVAGAVNSVLATVSGVFNAVRNVIQGAWNAAVSIVSGAWGAIVAAVNGGVGAVTGIVSTLPGRIFGALGDLVGRMLGYGHDIIDGLARGIENGVGRIGNAIGRIADRIKDEITSGFGLFSPSRVMRGYGENLGLGLAIGIDSMNAVVGRSASGIVRSVNDAMAGVSEGGVGTVVGSGANGTSGGTVVHAPVTVQVQAYPGMTREDAETLGAAAGAESSREIIATVGQV